MTLWKRPWCWERLKAGEEDDRGWDSWMASLIRWTGTWANSGRWWGTGRPGILQSMVWQKVRHNLATEQQQKWMNKYKKRTCLETHKGFPVGSDGKESACNAGDLGLTPGLGRSPWRKEWIFTPVFLPWKFYRQRSLVGYSSWGHKERDMTEGLELSLLGFPGVSDSKEFACNVEDLGLTLGSGRSPGEWNGYPLQYSCLENSRDRGTLRARVYGVMMSWTQLSD